MKNKYTNWKDEVKETFACCPSQERLNQRAMGLFIKIGYWHKLGILKNIDYLIFKLIILSVQANAMFRIEEDCEDDAPDFISFGYGGGGIDLVEVEDDFEELEF